MSNLTVTVIDSNEQLHALEPSRNELLDASLSDCVFLTWQWLSSWTDLCLGQKKFERLFKDASIVSMGE